MRIRHITQPRAKFTGRIYIDCVYRIIYQGYGTTCRSLGLFHARCNTRCFEYCSHPRICFPNMYHHESLSLSDYISKANLSSFRFDCTKSTEPEHPSPNTEPRQNCVNRVFLRIERPWCSDFVRTVMPAQVSELNNASSGSFKPALDH